MFEPLTDKEETVICFTLLILMSIGMLFITIYDLVHDGLCFDSSCYPITVEEWMNNEGS